MTGPLLTTAGAPGEYVSVSVSDYFGFVRNIFGRFFSMIRNSTSRPEVVEDYYGFYGRPPRFIVRYD